MLEVNFCARLRYTAPPSAVLGSILEPANKKASPLDWRFCWYTRTDSNRRLSRPKRDALSTELRVRNNES